MVLLKSATSEEVYAEIQDITNKGINQEISMIESYERRLALGKPTRTLLNQYIQQFDTKQTEEMRNFLLFLFPT